MGALTSKNIQAESPDLNINLETAKPTPEEVDTYTYVLNLLRPTVRILATLREYQGCSEYIRQAISNPCPETEEAAWEAVCPAAEKLREFYEYASVLEEIIPRLFTALIRVDAPIDNEDPTIVYRALEQRPALVRLFADVLDFVFEFDELKVSNECVVTAVILGA
jgi:hypothetical protein